MKGLLRDLRFAIGTLKRNARFTFVVVLVLALGIGAVTAVFSVINAVLLHPFPYKDAGELALLWASKSKDVRRGISGPDLRTLQADNHVFQGITPIFGAPGIPFSLESRTDQEIMGLEVGPSLFSTLGAHSYLGRTFLATEGMENVVVLSYPLWHGKFGGDRGIIGKTISLNHGTYSVIGVMPPEFFFPDPSIQLWVPLHMTSTFDQRGIPLFYAIARLNPGITFQKAQMDLDLLSSQLSLEFPDRDKGIQLGVFPLLEEIVGKPRTALWLLQGVMFLLLLIGCINIAHLLLARGLRRSTEISIRVAFGATGGGIVRQLVMESLLLAVVGGIASLGITWLAVHELSILGFNEIPRFASVRMSSGILLFAVSLSILTGVLTGLFPAIRTARVNLMESLKQGGTAYSFGGRGRSRDLLVVTEVAIAFTLTFGTALLLNSFIRLMRTDWGFRPNGVLAVRLQLPKDLWTNISMEQDFNNQVGRKLASLPGVTSVGIGTSVPAGSYTWQIRNVKIEGRAPIFLREWIVGPSYFKALGVPILKGQEYEQDDNVDSFKTIVVSKDLADEFWPNQNPIGKIIELLEMKKDVRSLIHRLPGFPRMTEAGSRLLRDPYSWDNIPYNVIGVVGSIRMFGLAPVESMPSVYVDYRQRPSDEPMMSENLIFHVPSVRAGLYATISDVVKDLNPQISIENLSTMDQLLKKATGGRSSERLLVVVWGTGGSLGLLLSVLGIYGMLGYGTAARTHEIGVRLACGAKPNEILRMILMRSLALVGVGLLVGLAGAFMATRGLSSYLYGVEASDPTTIVSVVVLFVIVGFLASLGPAYRAACHDPISALRYE